MFPWVRARARARFCVLGGIVCVPQQHQFCVLGGLGAVCARVRVCVRMSLIVFFASVYVHWMCTLLRKSSHDVYVTYRRMVFNLYVDWMSNVL